MRTTSLAGSLLALLIAAPVYAQFSAPIRYNEGPGIKLSDSMVFHPGIEMEGRYDSNALYSETAVGAPYLRVIGHIHLATLSPQRLTDGDGKSYQQKVDFRLKTAVSFRNYFSDNAAVEKQRGLEVDAGMGLTLFPQGMFSFSLADDFARTVAPPNMEVAKSLERDTNRASAKLRFAPGGGLLSISFGYAMNINIFEDSNLAYANSLFHELSLNVKWKLLPKTAVFLDVTEQITSYYDRNGGTPPAGLINNDSYPIRAYLGIGGLFTPRLSALVKLGYGNSITSTDGYDAISDQSYNMLLAKAEAGYQFTPMAKFKVGYEHNFQDSFIANYFVDEQIYAGYDHFIGGRFLLHGQIDYRYRQYKGWPQGGINGVVVDSLNHHLFTLALGFDWQIKEWVYVGVGYDAQIKSITDGPKVADTFFANDYTKHQIFGKVGVSY